MSRHAPPRRVRDRGGFDCESLDEARRRLAAALDLTTDDIVIEPRTCRVFRWAAAGKPAHGRCTVVDGSQGERLRVTLHSVEAPQRGA